jgi:hypothetical protein
MLYLKYNNIPIFLLAIVKEGFNSLLPVIKNSLFFIRSEHAAFVGEEMSSAKMSKSAHYRLLRVVPIVWARMGCRIAQNTQSVAEIHNGGV